ncbi:MAG: hotdog domain-containing protein [Gordonibacter pamelaeae]
MSDLGGFAAVANEELRRGFVRNRVAAPPEASNLFGKVHGGFLMYLVDVTACMAGYTLGKHNVTQQASLNFMRGVEVGDRVARAARRARRLVDGARGSSYRRRKRPSVRDGQSRPVLRRVDRSCGASARSRTFPAIPASATAARFCPMPA